MIASSLATSCRRRGGGSGGHRPNHARQRGRARLRLPAALIGDAQSASGEGQHADQARSRRDDPPGGGAAGLLPSGSRATGLAQGFPYRCPPLRRRVPPSLATRYFPLTVAIHKAMHAIPCLNAHSAINISGARQACDNRASKVIAPSRACLIYAQTEGATRLHSFYAHFPQFRDVGFAIRGASDVVIFAQQENAELRGTCVLFDFRLEIERLTALH